MNANPTLPLPRRPRRSGRGPLRRRALLANDEFFAEKENLLKPGRGIFIPDKYTDHGKWMDGWETRRRRTPGHDWCVVQLGLRGIIKHVDIDTNHFLGNHPPFASLDALCLTTGFPDRSGAVENLPWNPILPQSPLNPGSQNLFRDRATTSPGPTCG